jgi:hypothetical protein
MHKRRERYTPIKTKQAIENINRCAKKSLIINRWRKASIINFRFSQRYREEHIAISNVDEEKKTKEFNNVYEILKSLI